MHGKCGTGPRQGPVDSMGTAVTPLKSKTGRLPYGFGGRCIVHEVGVEAT